MKKVDIIIPGIIIVGIIIIGVWFVGVEYPNEMKAELTEAEKISENWSLYTNVQEQSCEDVAKQMTRLSIDRDVNPLMRSTMLEGMNTFADKCRDDGFDVPSGFDLIWSEP